MGDEVGDLPSAKDQKSIFDSTLQQRAKPPQKAENTIKTILMRASIAV
jgi:hypothetical protein